MTKQNTKKRLRGWSTNLFTWDLSGIFCYSDAHLKDITNFRCYWLCLKKIIPSLVTRNWYSHICILQRCLYSTCFPSCILWWAVLLHNLFKTCNMIAHFFSDNRRRFISRIDSFHVRYIFRTMIIIQALHHIMTFLVQNKNKIMTCGGNKALLFSQFCCFLLFSFLSLPNNMTFTWIFTSSSIANANYFCKSTINCQHCIFVCR